MGVSTETREQYGSEFMIHHPWAEFIDTADDDHDHDNDDDIHMCPECES